MKTKAQMTDEIQALFGPIIAKLEESGPIPAELAIIFSAGAMVAGALLTIEDRLRDVGQTEAADAVRAGITSLAEMG